MTPLTEWTRQEVWDALFSPEWSGYTSEELTLELLRREREAMRERCAKECDRACVQMGTLIGGPMDSDRLRAAIQCAGELAERIRRLQ